MVTPELLAILCCPETHQPLELAAPGTVAAINQKIARGELKNRVGERIDEPVEGGLERSDGKYFFPIRRGIPVLLIDQAILLE